ncbi:hypothetical protein AB1Y20_001231 [Prymnesium parvum]|uniref:PIG-P domain-containing protein n=1 Tax=Prymnesium parvum TaxID=97485 RepID=A0AB34KAH4_PRYPA
MKALYGFVAWIATHVCFALFIAWAYTPESILADLGITWYPNKYWALALPSFLVVSMTFAYAFHWTHSMMNLPPLESLSTLVDEFSNFPQDSDLGLRGLDERIPTVIDLPITYINKLLYQRMNPDYAGVPVSRVPSSERDCTNRGIETQNEAVPDAVDRVILNPRRRKKIGS